MFGKKAEVIGRFKSLIPGSEPFEFTGFKKFEDYYLTAELQTKNWINRNLPEDGVFIDVGANVGIISACAAIKAKKGRVISIEPTDTFKMLVENLIGGHFPSGNIEFFQTAIGSTTGIREDKIYKIWGDEPISGEFSFIRLDELVEKISLEDVDILKIDTDGYEFEVLVSGQKTIEKFRPCIIIELNEALGTRSITLQQIFDFMLDLKYDEAVILDGGNFAFTSHWKIGDIWPNRIEISSCREIQKFASKGALICDVEEVKPIHIYEEVKECLVGSEIYFQGLSTPWAFSVIYETPGIRSHNGHSILTIQGINLGGELGFAALNDDASKFLSDEGYSIRPGPFEIQLNCEDYKGRFVARTISNKEFSFQIKSVTLHEAQQLIPSEFFNIPSVTQITAKIFFHRHKLEIAQEMLPKLNYSDEGYLMEQSSAHFLKVFYQAVKPNYHFEVGTWEGFGSELALNNGAKFVWSLEKYEEYNPEYRSRYLDDKTPLKPGWLVSNDNRDRFIQIFGTTEGKLNLIDLPKIFDSILIDGGHDKMSVISDTSFALERTESGSFVIWDDYPAKMSDLNATRQGVLDAIKEMYEKLNNTFHLYHIQGTSLLVGVRK